jgi:hypothetical protein
MSNYRNILVLVFIAFALSIQVWLILIFALQHYPPSNLLTQTVFPEWWFELKPERDALHYHIFVFTALGMTAVILWNLRDRWMDALFMQRARLFLALETIWTFLLISAAFKIIVYAERPQLANFIFWIIVAASILGKIFFQELNGLLQKAYTILHSTPDCLLRWAEIIFPLLLISILYIPDTLGVTARDFLGEQYHHWDSSVMTPGWAYVKGCVLNVDVISQYGLGLPIVTAQLSKMIGGFTYENVLRVIMGISILYYLAWYLLLRSWLKNIWVVMAGLLFAIKIEIFHTLAYPIAFTYPSGTVMRYVFDVVLFALMWGHLKSGKYRYLWGGSIICGIAVFYMTTTGLCLALTWVAYLMGLVIFPSLRLRYLNKRYSWFALLACLPLIAAAGTVCLWFAEGRFMFTDLFWRNTQEFNNYFLNYFGTIPLTQNITDHNYLCLLVGLLIPLVYLGTFLIVASFYFWGIYSEADLLAAFISIYGIALFHYFMARSMSTNSYDVGLPYVFVLCFWLSKAVEKLSQRASRNAAIIAVIIAAYALVTNYNYIAYPNIWNFSRHPLTDPMVFSPLPDGRSYYNHLFSQLPMESRLPYNSLGETDEKLRSEKDFAGDEDLKKYYAQEFDFSADARLIDELVPPQGKVALVSSFETKILMDADRAPFFYYVPLVISRLMRMRTMVVVALYTQGHLQRTEEEIETYKPEYIFIERIFCKENIDLVNYKDGSAFLPLMRYIHAHYEHYRDGRFLMALKRKNP